MGDPTTWTRNDVEKSFFNPVSRELVLEYRNDRDETVTYTLLPLRIATYPTYLADFMIKRLIDFVIEDRKMGYVTPEGRAEIRKEIEV